MGKRWEDEKRGREGCRELRETRDKKRQNAHAWEVLTGRAWHGSCARRDAVSFDLIAGFAPARG